MSGTRHEQQLRRAVLQLSRHGDADIGAVLARLDTAQRDKLRGLLAELGKAGGAVEASPGQQADAPERDTQAFLRRVPPPFAERFERALVESGHLHGADSAPSAGARTEPRRMTERTVAVVAQAIAEYVRLSAPQLREQPPEPKPLLARWFGKGARR